MATQFKYEKFVRFMALSSAAALTLGMVLLFFSSGGPCGPDLIGAIALLLLILGGFGGVLFTLPWLLVWVMFAPIAKRFRD
jgi:hypothetical protein